MGKKLNKVLGVYLRVSSRIHRLHLLIIMEAKTLGSYVNYTQAASQFQDGKPDGENCVSGIICGRKMLLFLSTFMQRRLMYFQL